MAFTDGFGQFTDAFGEHCGSYYTINNEYRLGFTCFFQYCCGNCDGRHCCFNENVSSNSEALLIALAVVGVLVQIVVVIICCFCPCCCIYKMCRNPRPVVETQVTTVTNTNLIQQQSAMQGGQYPQYQPVLTQPGYGVQPMQTGPYQGQPYAAGPPPSYHVAASPGYPNSQSAYDEGQAMYTMQPPAQPGVAYVPSETSNQPAHNPVYMQPPKTGY